MTLAFASADKRFRVAMTHAHSNDYVNAHKVLKSAGFEVCPFCDGKIKENLFSIGES